MKNWAAYQKFIVAAVGATIAILNVILVADLSTRNGIISAAIAAITALAVYIVPNQESP